MSRPDTEDEMCNFYIMYHTQNDGRPLARENCWDEAPLGIHFPPLPVLPPSQLSHSHHHHHSPMGDGPDDDAIEIIAPNPITSPGKETTSPSLSRGKVDKVIEEEDHYMCPSPIPPGPVPAQCVKTTPTNQGAGGKEGEGTLYNIVLADDWPFNGISDPHVEAETGRGGALGQVTSVAVAPDGSVFVLHRGPRVWDSRTFTINNLFADAAKGPISTPVLLKFSGDGELRGVWGGGLFYLPHSVTVDRSGAIWITDVAMHQVLRFDDLSGHKPSLSLGHMLIPGSKPGYFCKPADVAVASSGTFYVADGYCNSRVLAYNPDGMVRAVLGDFPIEGETLLVPHSLTLSPSEDQLYVADRENQRIVVMDVTGAGNVRVFPVGGLDRVFAVVLSGLSPGGWPMLVVVEENGGERGYGLTITEKDGVDSVWGVEEVFHKVHDLAVDPVNKAVYVTELTPARIWKFSIVSEGDASTVSATHLPTTETTTGTTRGTTNLPSSTTTQQTPSTTEGPQETTEGQTTATTSPTTEPPNTQPTEPSETPTESAVSSGPVSTEDTPSNTPEGSNSSSDSPPSNHSTSSSGSPAYSGDADDNAEDNAEMTGNDASNYPASQGHKSGDKVATPAFHYGLFVAIFAIVALILVVVVGILKEHRFLRFRARRVGTQASSEGKTSRETLHSLLGPSKLGFSRLRTYDSDSEVEEFPIFSRL
jgi:peptidylamidoglycolate lyase